MYPKNYDDYQAKVVEAHYSAECNGDCKTCTDEDCEHYPIPQNEDQEDR